MASTIKTKVTSASVTGFISSVKDETQKNDSLILLKLFKKATGEKPKMWGPSIIGFGTYHYKSERSRQEGDWPLTGFSPRKQNLTLYITTEFTGYAGLMKKLGKFKTTGGCLYIKKLSDVDLKVLEEIVKKSFIAKMKKHSTSNR